MQRFGSSLLRRSYATSPRVMMAEAAAPSYDPNANNQMIVNFCTPHTPIFTKKEVDKVMLPGAAGEYGVTAKHVPLISQLQAGIVTIIHLDGQMDKYFVAGGFAITKADSVTEISASEAVPLGDLDENAIKTGFADATRDAATHAEGTAERAVAQIQIDTFKAMAKAINLAL